MKRVNISSGTIWEDKVGYSRAVRIDNMVFVSGTVAVNEKNEIVAPGNPYEQTKFIFSKIERALKKTGGSLNDVVRTRMFTVDIKYSEEIGKAHAELFSIIKPASTMLEISKLVEPELLVEIEVEAVIQKCE